MELPHLIHLLTDHLSNMHLVTLESILQERFMLKIFLVITKKKCLNVIFIYLPQREKCPHLELFWSAFSRIWTEYGEILPISPYLSIFSLNARISPYSVRTSGNADQNNSEYEHFLHRVHV